MFHWPLNMTFSFYVPSTSCTSTPLARHSERKRRISFLRNASGMCTKMYSFTSEDVSLAAQQDVLFLCTVHLMTVTARYEAVCPLLHGIIWWDCFATNPTHKACMLAMTCSLYKPVTSERTLYDQINTPLNTRDFPLFCSKISVRPPLLFISEIVVLIYW